MGIRAVHLLEYSQHVSNSSTPLILACSHFRYIFVNMFTGVVVESFAYVYQMPGGASLNREEMRM